MLVTTIMSNMGLSIAMEKFDIKQIKTKVGDRHVLEEMIKRDAVIGGEDSGHLIFLEHHTTGDGILSALQLLSVMKEKNKPLSELTSIMKVLPQVTLNVKVKSKPPLEEQSEIIETAREVENELKGKGRVLVRYSGTQSVCRVMVEGPTYSQTEEFAKKIAEAVRIKLG
jgi:phosphoglucosamine mutase